MFENLYKKVDEKVQPSEELINETKLKMKDELNNKNKVVHVNFYKYATIAACLVIFIGVLSVNTQKDIAMEYAPSINENVNDSYKESNITTNGNPFNSVTFDSAMSSGTATSATVAKYSIFDSILEFFENILQWFKELLF